MLKVLDLFSGIGGFSLGLERAAGFETVAFCEIEPFPQKVLKKHWPDVPIYEDVRELSRDRLEADGLGRIDVITGGYPCQPFSYAGKRDGAEDDRHIWPEVKRIVASIRPRWCVFENVSGHITMGLDEVLSDLEGEEYTCWPVVILACAVDAPHRRDRVWVIAHDDNARDRASGSRINKNRSAQIKGRKNQPQFEFSRHGEDVADTISGEDNTKRVTGRQSRQPVGRDREAAQQKNGSPSPNGPEGHWPTEPPVGRVAHGIPRRVDRLKGLGNAVIPQIPEMIGNAILEAENETD